ncbi:alpha-amylase family glycosyl hydrolase [Novilysobacter selenitireducens]|uniref:Glycosyl hydrolase family 13 catalytic domain-containing protein n=1 Tax=Novilysobacter selenitireducens TaxID=2872639 RepID=A0ABS7T2Q9_9GAMM|nr:alpha-amylase family glycosyl hydrolase [Lysobacter selenitireducens]MBZ4038157.1 hypothetical protein [Lysobacter selenitireducens]
MRLAGLAALLALASGAHAEDGPLHVPSPDWRDAVIYFAMIDRFDDGDPSNNDQGVGEYDPAQGRTYSGGDLRGLTRRLDYVQGLGATALWITPPVANQWWNPGRGYSGYHGYWASDFSTVDAHYGSKADYVALSRALHGRGMHLVQDVVVNHVGDWIACDADVDPKDDASIAAHCRVRTDAQGRSAPAQAPLERNDPQEPVHRREALYHFTPEIADYSDRTQELTYALADLDDLDTESPAVRRLLRQAYGDWIRDVGVDAFRVDTAFHVPADFFPDFLHAEDVDAPGVVQVARETGRADFLSFGEGFGSGKPFADAQARKLDAYMRVPGGLPSMINFPLYGTLGDVIARGRPTAELQHRIETTMTVHADPWRMPTFIDNHDVDRFLAGASEPALRQALLAMLTLPGIPVIYYGTEQGFDERRRTMFAGGHGSGGRDHFDVEAPLYRYLQRAIALRRDHRVFSRGTPTVLASSAARAGAIAWRMDYDAAADRTGNDPSAGTTRALVILNTADSDTLLDGLDTGLPPGTRLQPLFAIDGTPDAHTVDADGRVTLVLPARSGQVWRIDSADSSGPAARIEGSTERAAPLTLEAAEPPTPSSRRKPGPIAPPEPVATQTLALTGHAPGRDRIRLVIDGDLANAQSVDVDDSGDWRATVRTDAMTDPAVEHRAVAFDPISGATSDAHTFKVDLDWQAAADIKDPAGDDTGPTGTYTYPTDAGWRDVHPADIQRVRAWTAGGALRIEVTLRAISTAWNPDRGFDHVAVTAFLELPGRAGGATVIPQQHATLPDGMRWHRRLRAHGWSNALFAHDGADADNEGTPTGPVAALAVDRDARTLTFTLPADALGHPATLEGARLYVTTWDFDAGYRDLAPDAGATTFGGGSTTDPKVMDEAGPITL